MRHFQSRCQTVRAQHVSDLEDLGAFWQVRKIDCYSLSSLFFFFFLLLSSMLFSASTDKTVAVWDSETGERVKRLKGHTSFVNSCYPARRGPQLVCTGSDDGTVKVGVVCLCWGFLRWQNVTLILSSHLCYTLLSTTLFHQTFPKTDTQNTLQIISSWGFFFFYESTDCYNHVEQFHLE